MTTETKNAILENLKEWRMVSRELAGFAIFTGFFGVIWLLLTREAPVVNKDAILILLGVLSGAFKDVCGFLWGGSVGSEKKSETLAKVVQP